MSERNAQPSGTIERMTFAEILSVIPARVPERDVVFYGVRVNPLDWIDLFYECSYQMENDRPVLKVRKPLINPETGSVYMAIAIIRPVPEVERGQFELHEAKSLTRSLVPKED